MVVEIEKPIGQIQKLRPFLPGKTQEELEQILAYWEEIKEEWARKKKKFWINCDDREDFLKLLNYKRKHQWKALWKYKYMDTIEWLEKEKFIEEYLYDDVLYSWKIEETEVEEKTYSYEDWKRWKVIMKEWVELDFSNKCLWSKWVKAIAKKIELKGWVFLNLHFNQIWDEWAEVISKMELKKWVRLNLDSNEIWDEWAKSIAEKPKNKFSKSL